ncbi:hypothetical protein ACEZCY_03235 [Streptacidiphilus sp. N1-12]|uniref:Uncharacterized protein n=2 Tax=Streptacidiphilus alkalitolerans TaxID=3342712 RepID=A0ABV6W870_9ACTN
MDENRRRPRTQIAVLALFCALNTTALLMSVALPPGSTRTGAMTVLSATLILLIAVIGALFGSLRRQR